MGVETAIAIGAGSQLLGAGLQYGQNRAARKRTEGVDDLIKQNLNSGQDSFLQYLRSNPTALKPFQFDASEAFKQLTAQDALETGDQVNALRAGTGSLGERFGSGFAAREAMLRSRIAAAHGARNAGISQSSFNNALNLGAADFNSTRSNQLALLQMLQGGAAQQQAFAAGPGSTGAMVGQTGGDIASLLTLLQYLNKGGGSGAAPTVRPNLPATINYFPGMGYPS